jgi:glycosyltransferase involved in cell wall biosynthesis
MADASMPKVLLVTNFAPHYRAPFFERLSAAVDVEYLFFSSGSESYWQRHLGTSTTRVNARTYPSRRLPGGLGFNPRLTRELWTRDYDVLIKCINGRLELASSYAIAKARRKAFVLWTTIWWQPVDARGWLSQPPLQTVYRGANSIITDGPHISRFVAANGAEEEKVFAAEFSVDNDWFGQPVDESRRSSLRLQLGGQERPLILSVARLVEEKGLDVLVRAAALLSDLRPVVVVVGTGPLGDRLRQQAASLGVDLRLLGGMPPADMPAIYATADVLAMPSVTTRRVREPWGLAVNEAHCQRVPVVASDAVGAAAGRLVVHEETGLVVPERDEEALSAALRRILTDPSLGKRLAAAGHERVQATNYDRMVDAFRAAIDHAVATRPVRGPIPSSA